MATDLFFLRHGQAGDRESWQGPDDERPLTGEGTAEMQAVADFLAQRALQVLTGVHHYARRLGQLADHVREPGWASTLEPAAARVRTNLNALRQLLQHRQAGEIRSAEDVVDAAEAYAARIPGPGRRAALLSAARLLCRIDQAVVNLAADLGH